MFSKLATPKNITASA